MPPSQSLSAGKAEAGRAFEDRQKARRLSSPRAAAALSRWAKNAHPRERATTAALKHAGRLPMARSGPLTGYPPLVPLPLAPRAGRPHPPRRGGRRRLCPGVGAGRVGRLRQGGRGGARGEGRQQALVHALRGAPGPREGDPVPCWGAEGARGREGRRGGDAAAPGGARRVRGGGGGAAGVRRGPSGGGRRGGRRGGGAPRGRERERAAAREAAGEPSPAGAPDTSSAEISSRAPAHQAQL